MSLGREFWGGLTLISIWMAVLFVGVFGGNIQTAGSDGSSSTWPVVVIVAIAAVVATVSVGRWAFRPSPVEEDLRHTVEEQRRALEELTARLADLPTKPPAT